MEVQRVVNIPSHTHLVELERAWEEEGHLYLQMELCSKSLNQYIEEGHHLSEVEVSSWLIIVRITCNIVMKLVNVFCVVYIIQQIGKYDDGISLTGVGNGTG